MAFKTKFQPDRYTVSWTELETDRLLAFPHKNLTDLQVVQYVRQYLLKGAGDEFCSLHITHTPATEPTEAVPAPIVIRTAEDVQENGERLTAWAKRGAEAFLQNMEDWCQPEQLNRAALTRLVADVLRQTLIDEPATGDGVDLASSAFETAFADELNTATAEQQEQAALGTALTGALAAGQRELQDALNCGCSPETAEKLEERAIRRYMDDALEREWRGEVEDEDETTEQQEVEA